MKKPERAELKQWWEHESWTDGPVRLYELNDRWAQGRDVDGCADPLWIKDLLGSPSWRYLGNGERPDLGGSDVAGKEGR